MGALPKPSSPGRYYVLKSYHEYSKCNNNGLQPTTTTLSEDHIKARFLERNTFGPTKESIASFTTPTEWLITQFEEPLTSHRQFFRERATHWHSYTGRYGLLHSGPCQTDARYRKFAFLSTDAKSYLEIQRSPIDASKLILRVGGELRTVVDGPFQYINEDNSIVDVPLNDNQIHRYVLVHNTICIAATTLFVSSFRN